jgi:SPP1 gp7 family putative phage head morphogenesis protein
MVKDSNEKLFMDITERQLQFFRVDASVRKDVLKELKRIESLLVSLLTDSSTLTQRRLKTLLTEVRKLIEEAYKAIDTRMITDLEHTAEIESFAMLKSLGAVSISASDLTVDKVKRLVKTSLINGAPSSEWWSRQSIQLQQSFEDTLRSSIILGETNDQIVRRIRGTRAFNFTDGIMNVARNDAEALVRSSVQKAANQARFETMESAKEYIRAYRHVGTLDSRTTPICIVRDGKEWDAETKEPIGHNLAFGIPPLHWNCRSTLVPLVKNIGIPKGAKRASQDGEVDASLTFEDFLKKKSPAFVEDVLGKGKADLYLNGKITIRQLLDQSGNPLTLSQLRLKYT